MIAIIFTHKFGSSSIKRDLWHFLLCLKSAANQTKWLWTVRNEHTVRKREISGNEVKLNAI